MKTSKLTLSALLVLTAFYPTAAADNFIWEGYSWTSPWYGYVVEATSWGSIVGNATSWGGDGSYHNGWGKEWFGGSDCSYFPNSTDSVTIPSGFNVLNDAAASCLAVCGSLTVQNNASLDLSIYRVAVYGPVITNEGTITGWNYAGTRCGFDLYGDVTIAGTSPLTFNDGCIVSKGTVRQLIIEQSQAITGATYIGSNTSEMPVNIINNGEIQGSAMVYALNIYGETNCTNNGYLTADEYNGTYHGQINLRGHWDNSNGTLLARNGAVIELQTYDIDGDSINDGSISGGVFETEGSGEIRTGNNGFLISNITNNGLLHFQNYYQGTVAGTLTNNGTILIGEAGWTAGNGYMNLNSDTLLQGTGVSILGYAGIIAAQSATLPVETLTIEEGHTLKMVDGSNLGISGQEIQVVNNGQLEFNPELTSNSMGTIRVTGSGITNNCEMIIRAGQLASNSERLEYFGPFQQSATGRLTVDGWLRMQNDLAITNGRLTGTGTVNMNGYQLVLGSDSVLDFGRNSEALSFINGTLFVDGGTSFQWRPGNGTANTISVDTLFLSTAMMNLQVIPQGAAMVSGDYVLLACNATTGNPVWNISLPTGWTCDGVAIENNNVVLKNLNGTQVSFNYLDFAQLAQSWLLSTGDTNFNDNFDFVNNDTIDLDDLDYMTQYWLNN